MWRDPYAYLIEFTGANALAANGERTLPANIDREADFEIYRLAHLATSPDYRVALQDQDDRLLIGGVAPATNLFGDGQRPARLPGARLIKRTNQIRSRSIDRSGAPNTVRQLFVGAQVFPAPPFVIPPFRYAEPYTLELNFGTEGTDDFPQVPANGSAEGAIRIPGDSWFEVHTLAISRTAAATLQLLTNGFREWFRFPTHVDLLGASDFTTALNAAAQWPYEFKPAKLLPVNTALVVRLADLSGALNSIRVTLWGLRRYF